MNLAVIVVGGLGVWTFGPTDAVTLGASILIFGTSGYLLGRGLFERHIVDIVIAGAVALLYGTMISAYCPPRRACPGRGICSVCWAG